MKTKGFAFFHSPLSVLIYIINHKRRINNYFLWKILSSQRKQRPTREKST